MCKKKKHDYDNCDYFKLIQDFAIKKIITRQIKKHFRELLKKKKQRVYVAKINDNDRSFDFEMFVTTKKDEKVNEICALSKELINKVSHDI